MTPHIEAKAGDYADIVLLPGDPLRAKWIADTYLNDVKQVNSVRNMLGFTGILEWNDRSMPISVQGGGMGMASNGIYIHELYKIYGVETIIRVGSCGGIHPLLDVGDIVAATTAHTDNAMTKKFGDNISPSVSYHLLQNFMKASPKAIAGPIMSSDWFYNPDKEWWKKQQRLGTLAVEMETHILYALANKFNKQALSVCTVADHLDGKQKDLTAEQREKGFNRMIESVFTSLC